MYNISDKCTPWRALQNKTLSWFLKMYGEKWLVVSTVIQVHMFDNGILGRQTYFSRCHKSVYLSGWLQVCYMLVMWFMRLTGQRFVGSLWTRWQTWWLVCKVRWHLRSLRPFLTSDPREDHRCVLLESTIHITYIPHSHLYTWGRISAMTQSRITSHHAPRLV